MGRSRITRTFHNKPKSTIRVPNRRTESPTKNKPKYKPSKSTQSKGLIPQAHAQQSGQVSANPQGKYGTIESTENQIHGEKWGSFGFTIDKTGKARGRNVKIRKSIRGDGVADTTVTSKYTDLDTEKYTKEQTPLGLFAQGVGNQAHDIGGSVHGLVTGQDYQVKSVLNRSLEHAFAGDWDSAGKVISDNPYRFAGNVATEVGLTVVPLGFMARGAGIAGKVGSAVSKTKKLVGGKGSKYTKEFAKKEKTLKMLQHENIHIAVTKKGSSSPRKLSKPTRTEFPKTDQFGNKVSKTEWIRRERLADEGIKRSESSIDFINPMKYNNPFGQRIGGTGSRMPNEGLFDTTLKANTKSSGSHNWLSRDKTFIKKGEINKPGSFKAGTSITKNPVSPRHLKEIETKGYTNWWYTTPKGKTRYKDIKDIFDLHYNRG